MFGLVILIITIALAAIVSSMVVSHIPLVAYQQSKVRAQILAGTTTIQAGMSRYLNTIRDTAGIPVYPGDGADMTALLEPAHTFIPPSIRGMVWELKNVKTPYLGYSPGMYICLKPNNNTEPESFMLSAIESVMRDLPPAAAFLSDKCGATSNVPGGTYLTYWTLYSQGSVLNANMLQPPVIAVASLGSAKDYSLFGASVTVAGASTANMKVGGSGTAISGTVIGSEQHFSDAESTKVASDIALAYAFNMTIPQSGSIFLGSAPVAGTTFAGDIAGLTFYPGVYFAGAAITNSINVTLDAKGNPDAKFVFQITAAFAPAAASTVTLRNGALASNVIWVVTGATAVGAGGRMDGTIISPAAIGFGLGANLVGRALTTSGAITLSDSVVTTE